MTTTMVHVPGDEAIEEPGIERGHRCDRCYIAEAYVRVDLTTGGELHFCAHHFAKHETALRKVTSEVVDGRHALQVKLGVGMAEGQDAVHPSRRDKPKKEGE